MRALALDYSNLSKFVFEVLREKQISKFHSTLVKRERSQPLISNQTKNYESFDAIRYLLLCHINIK